MISQTTAIGSTTLFPQTKVRNPGIISRLYQTKKAENINTNKQSLETSTRGKERAEQRHQMKEEGPLGKAGEVVVDDDDDEDKEEKEKKEKKAQKKEKGEKNKDKDRDHDDSDDDSDDDDKEESTSGEESKTKKRRWWEFYKKSGE